MQSILFDGRKQLTPHQLLRWGKNQLSKCCGPQEAQWLLEWALGGTPLLSAPDRVGARAQEKYRSAIQQRRRGFPLQHITGEMSFRYLNLHAGPGVFVVRPETELLVQCAQEQISSLRLEKGDQPLRGADLCTGSAAIALALATEERSITLDCVELSKTALKYAYRNLEKYRGEIKPGSSVTLVQDDATKALKDGDGTYDFVVSNPPYVPGTPTQVEALFDPEMALYGGGEDGMVLPRGIIVRAFDLLKEGGAFVMEHDDTQAQKVATFARQTGFSTVESKEDLAGVERFLVAKK